MHDFADVGQHKTCLSLATADLDPSAYSLEFPDEGSRLVFKGKTKAFKEGETTDYAVDIELFDKIRPETVKKSLTGKSLYFTVQKKGKELLS